MSAKTLASSDLEDSYSNDDDDHADEIAETQVLFEDYLAENGDEDIDRRIQDHSHGQGDDAESIERDDQGRPE